MTKPTIILSDMGASAPATPTKDYGNCTFKLLWLKSYTYLKRQGVSLLSRKEKALGSPCAASVFDCQERSIMSAHSFPSFEMTTELLSYAENVRCEKRPNKANGTQICLPCRDCVIRLLGALAVFAVSTLFRAKVRRVPLGVYTWSSTSTVGW